MGGGHHHHEIKIPDYRIYKVENCPELVEVQKALNRVGLKDPWLRNEVWRFDPAIQKVGMRQRIILSLFKGLPVGIGFFLATLAIEKALGIDWHNPRNLEEYKHGHH